MDKTRIFIAFGFLAALAFFSACTPMPIPTVRAATPVPTAKPITPTMTPTLTPVPLNTLAPTATNIPTNTPTVLPTLTVAPITYEHSARALLLEADVWNDTAAMPHDAHVPGFRLYGDGLVVFAGAPASLTSGFDAAVRVGRLSDADIQTLLAALTQLGFFNLNDAYEPRPKPTDQPTATITVYTTKAKTVRVYAPDDPRAPQSFTAAFKRVMQAIPTDAQTFTPTDGYLLATDAGGVNNVPAKETLGDWSNLGVRLADATDGVTVSGATFAQIVALRASKPTVGLYREGSAVYRVRFAPNLPRAVHLTDWVGMIVSAPREFEGRAFDLIGYYRGGNLYGEARGTPFTKNDWVLLDASGAIFVTGVAPQGLDLGSRADAWSMVRVRAIVVYARNGTSYLEAKRVDNVNQTTPSLVATPTLTATPIAITTADAAIALIKVRYPDVAKIQKAQTGLLGSATDIKVFDRGEGWELAFVDGSGDCPAGCINNHYTYFSVSKTGRVTKVGEYTRTFNATTNTYDTSGTPFWGVPK